MSYNTVNQDYIKGTFVDALEITSVNIESVIDKIVPLDQRDEVRAAIESGDESVYYASHRYENESEARCYVFFPSEGLGGCALGGYTQWFNGSCLDEIERAWENEIGF